MNAPNARRTLWPVAICVAALALTALSWRATANAVQSAKPVTIGLINMESVMNGLAEIEDQQKRIDALMAQRRRTIDEMSRQLTAAQEELKLLPENSSQRVSKSREITEMSIKLRVEGEVAVGYIDAEKGEIYANLFRKIEDASRRFAERNEFDIILSTDAFAEVRNGTEQQVKSFIVSRRVIHASKQIDVSDQLLTMMNNEYRANATSRP